MSETVPTGAPEPVAAPAPAAAPAEPAAAPAAPETPLAPSLLGDKPAEATPDGAKPGEEKPGEEKPAEPISYEKFTLPEGVSAEDPLLGVFASEAGKLGIPQDKAQALVTAVGAKIGEQVAQAAAAQVQAWVAMNEQWQADVRALPEFAGPKFDAMRESVAKLWDNYVGPANSPERQALNQALQLTGAGNHPAVVKMMARIAADYTESRLVRGAPPRGPRDIAAQMYPTMQPKTG